MQRLDPPREADRALALGVLQQTQRQNLFLSRELGRCDLVTSGVFEGRSGARYVTSLRVLFGCEESGV